MTQPILLTGNTYGIELTKLGDEFKNFKILAPDDIWAEPYLKYSYRSIYHTKRRGGKAFYCSEEYPLEPGNWQLICMARDITEAKAKELVRSSVWHFPEIHTRYVDYKYPFDRENKQRWGEGFGTAIESFRSLLTSKGLKLETTLLIKKVS